MLHPIREGMRELESEYAQHQITAEQWNNRINDVLFAVSELLDILDRDQFVGVTDMRRKANELTANHWGPALSLLLHLYNVDGWDGQTIRDMVFRHEIESAFE